jgi:glycosyltransferase involved in cell wall biosynthesis
VPVIGSALGGIAEGVRDDIDGKLVTLGSIPAWEKALQEIVNDPSILARWRAAILPQRRMGTVAEEMRKVYELVTGRIQRAASAS